MSEEYLKNQIDHLLQQLDARDTEIVRLRDRAELVYLRGMIASAEGLEQSARDSGWDEFADEAQRIIGDYLKDLADALQPNDNKESE